MGWSAQGADLEIRRHVIQKLFELIVKVSYGVDELTCRQRKRFQG